MSACYGVLERKPDTGQGEAFMGTLDVPFVLSAPIAIVPNPNAHGDQWGYKVKIKSGSGNWVDYGNAKEAELKNGNGVYYRIVIDGPALASAVWLSGFVDDNDTSKINMIWTRPKAQGPRAGQTSGAAIDDSIPY